MITIEQEDALVTSLRENPDDHLRLDMESVGSDSRGRVLVSRDGLRRFLHRELYERCILPLDRYIYLLPNCSLWGCQNPWHYRASKTPYLPRERHYTPPRKGTPPHWWIEAQRTHCPRGHEYTPENTYVWKGHRSCRTCKSRSGTVPSP